MRENEVEIVFVFHCSQQVCISQMASHRKLHCRHELILLSFAGDAAQMRIDVSRLQNPALPHWTVTCLAGSSQLQAVVFTHPDVDHILGNQAGRDIKSALWPYLACTPRTMQHLIFFEKP